MGDDDSGGGEQRTKGSGKTWSRPWLSIRERDARECNDASVMTYFRSWRIAGARHVLPGVPVLSLSHHHHRWWSLNRTYHQEYTVRLWWKFRWHYVIVVLGYVRWGSVRHSATLYMFTRRMFDNNNLSEEVCALLSVSLIYLCSHKEKATGNWSRKPIYLHAFHSKLPVFAILTLNDYTNEILNIVIKITVPFSFALSYRLMFSIATANA